MTGPELQSIRAVRERTGQPPVVCRDALLVAGWDVERAVAAIILSGETCLADRWDLLRQEPPSAPDAGLR